MSVLNLFGLSRVNNYSKYFIDAGITPDPRHDMLDTVVCGVEVEVENMAGWVSPLSSTCFQMKDDHSLRNNGVEVITTPLNSPLVPNALRLLWKALPSKADFSKRTSVHVHLDVQSLEPNQVINIIHTYILFENTLFRFVDKDRKSSIFCVPITETNLCDKSSSQNFDSMVSIWSKYCALNLKRVSDLGTIEFRHLEGTKDVEKVINWIYLLLCIYDFAIKRPPRKECETIFELNTNSEYLAYARRVFGPFMDLLDLENLEQDMAEGVRYLKRIKRNTHVKITNEGYLYRKLFSKEAAKVKLTPKWATTDFTNTITASSNTAQP